MSPTFRFARLKFSRTSCPRSGFSLIEVMVAILILGIALVGLTQGISTALGSSKESELQTTAAAFGARATVTYIRDYPVTVNDAARTVLAAQIAGDVAGEGAVNAATPPVMGAEDFSFMLEARPGAFIFLGNGDSEGLHHPAYDFDDRAIPYGTSYWVRLVESALTG